MSDPEILSVLRNFTPLHQYRERYEPRRMLHVFAANEAQATALRDVCAAMWESVVELRTKHPGRAGLHARHEGGYHLLRDDELLQLQGLGISDFAKFVSALILSTLEFVLKDTLLRIDLASQCRILEARAAEKMDEPNLFQYFMGELSPGMFMLGSFVGASIALQSNPTAESTEQILRNSIGHIEQWASLSSGAFAVARLQTILPSMQSPEEMFSDRLEQMFSAPNAFVLSDGALALNPTIAAELRCPHIRSLVLEQSPTRVQCTALFLSAGNGRMMLADSVEWAIEIVRAYWSLLDPREA